MRHPASRIKTSGGVRVRDRWTRPAPHLGHGRCGDAFFESSLLIDDLLKCNLDRNRKLHWMGSMGVLLVVRHGQASFLAENYDRLSARGEQQARLLGANWAARGLRITQVVTGPAERQIRTAALAGEMFRQAGLPWPEPVVDGALDEFPAEQVIRTFLPPLAERYTHLAESVRQFQAATDSGLKQRLFDRVLRDVSLRWLQGEIADASFITWPDFCERIAGSVRHILSQAAKSSTVAVFTSAGPTAATARLALGLSGEATLNLTWTVRNASVSEFLFTQGRFSLSTFNTTPHLADPSLVTYR